MQNFQARLFVTETVRYCAGSITETGEAKGSGWGDLLEKLMHIRMAVSFKGEYIWSENITKSTVVAQLLSSY